MSGLLEGAPDTIMQLFVLLCFVSSGWDNCRIIFLSLFNLKNTSM